MLTERLSGRQDRGFLDVRKLGVHRSETFRHLLAIELVEKRLRIEGVKMTGSTGHEQPDHALGFGWKMLWLGCQRIRETSA